MPESREVRAENSCKRVPRSSITIQGEISIFSTRRGGNLRGVRANAEISLDRRNHERNRAKYDEDEIAGQTQPLDQVRTSTADVIEAACMPVAVLHDVPDLQHAAGEQTKRHHHRQANVGPEKSGLDVFFDTRPARVVAGLTQHEYH